MKRLGILAYGVAIVSVALLTARETIDPSVYLYQEHNGGMFALGVTGWFIATLGPISLSICVWLLAQRLNARWVLHLMFIPLALMVCKGGASILFYASGVPDGDSMMMGSTLFAATGFLLVTLLAHAIALVTEVYKIVGLRTNGS